MTVSLRSLALGFGLGIALVASSSAFAAPALPRAPMPPPRTTPTPLQPNPAIAAGLRTTATVGPRTLASQGISMEVHRAPRVETLANRVRMDRHTQLWLHFRAEKNVDYDISCLFNGRSRVLTMDYASNRFVRQQTAAPTSSGRLSHRLFRRSKTENVKVYMQARGNLDWRSCTVRPV